MSSTQHPTAAYVGLDLSLASTGIAVIGNFGGYVARVETKSTSKSSDVRIARLRSITKRIIDQLPTKLSLHVAVEGPAFGSNDPGAHMRAGLWWMVRGALDDFTDDVLTIPPSSVKKYATGRGNSRKDEVLAAVIRRYPDINVTGNDEADALVLAAMMARHDGAPIEATMPQVNLTAMKGIAK